MAKIRQRENQPSENTQELFNLIDFVREYEKTGLEGVSGFALVHDCCHIVATVYSSGMDNHCVIFTIFLDHDLCIFMAFCGRQHECQMQISLCKTLRSGLDPLVRRAFRAEDSEASFIIRI